MLVLSHHRADRDEARVKEKRNEDGGEPLKCPRGFEASGLVQVDLEDLLSQMSYAIDP